MIARKYLLFFIAGFAGATLFRSFFNWGWALAGFFLLLALIIATLRVVDRRSSYWLLIIFLLGLVAGTARYEIKDKLTLNIPEGYWNSEVKVIDEPDVRDNYTRLLVSLPGTNANGTIIAGHYPQFQYGDKLQVSGDIKRYTQENKDDIAYQFFYPRVQLISSGNGGWLKTNLFKLKNKFIETLGVLLPEPHASLEAGLTVGAKQSLGKDLLNEFVSTGVIHMVVISGYNITIIAVWILKIFSFLPKVFGYSAGALAIILFSIMTGGGAATVRAAIMAIIALIARGTGRVYEASIALTIGAFLMLLHNPKILVFDAGFQLSFLATLGLIYFSKPIENFLKHWMFKNSKHPVLLKIAELTATTSSAQLMVLPWLLYKFGNLSIVALPVNILVLGVIPVAMALGFFTGLVGFVSLALATPIALLTYVPLAYMLSVIHLFASLPFASYHIDQFPLAITLAIYAVYLLYLTPLETRSHLWRVATATSGRPGSNGA